LAVEAAGGGSPAPAAARAVAILTLLAEAHGAPLGLAEIARALGIAKSSTFNLCAVLEDGGLVQRGDAGYTLGRRTVELGGAYLATFDQVREFYKICSDSDRLSHELLQIAVLDGTDVLYLARHEGRAPLRLSASIGDRYPASVTAVGNALLALLDPDEVAARFAEPRTLPALTDRSTTTLAGLQKKLAATRRRGYAIDDGEVHPSVYGVAMVIPPRASGEAPLSIGVSMMKPASTEADREAVIEELRSAVNRLSNPMVVLGAGKES
jgi:IclR family transcriptional regulator, blcABC operon repressor